VNLLILEDQKSISYEIWLKASTGSPKHFEVDETTQQFLTDCAVNAADTLTALSSSEALLYENAMIHCRCRRGAT